MLIWWKWYSDLSLSHSLSLCVYIYTSASPIVGERSRRVCTQGHLNNNIYQPGGVLNPSCLPSLSLSRFHLICPPWFSWTTLSFHAVQRSMYRQQLRLKWKHSSESQGKINNFSFSFLLLEVEKHFVYWVLHYCFSVPIFPKVPSQFSLEFLFSDSIIVNWPRYQILLYSVLYQSCRPIFELWTFPAVVELLPFYLLHSYLA